MGCVAQKRARPLPARWLYDSQLFDKRSAYAESLAARLDAPWAILSARRPGIFLPYQVVAPYDVRMGDLSAAASAQMPWEISRQLRRYFGPLGLDGATIEVHAGADYRQMLARACHRLAPATVRIHYPLEGLGIGAQLGWYKARLARLRNSA